MSDTVNYRRVWNTDRFSVGHDKNGNVTFGPTVSKSEVVANDNRVGSKCPGWRKKIATHSSATTDLTGVKHFALTSYGVANQTVRATGSINTSWGALLDNGMSFNGAVSGAVDPEADNIARSRLLQSVISAQNNWRGGNFLAEIRETMHFLRHPLESFYHQSWSYVGKLGNLRNVRRAKDFNLSKSLADAWLAYAFGVRPLVADVKDAYSLLKHQLGSVYGADTIPIRGTGRRQTANTTPNFSVSVPNVTSTFCTQTTKFTFAVKYYGAIKATPPGVGLAAEQAGLGLYDIVPAAWEATAFSFLVDYFVNVQEMLDAMRYWSVNLAWLNRGVRNNSTVTRSGPRADSDATFIRDMDGSLAIRALTFVARTSSVLPYPSWHFKMPGFPSLKWMNMSALLAQYQDTMKQLIRGR